MAEVWPQSLWYFLPGPLTTRIIANLDLENHGQTQDPINCEQGKPNCCPHEACVPVGVWEWRDENK